MEVSAKQQRESNQVKKGAEVANNGLKAKRAKCPGVRVIGGRIYDSENGKCCHQCRQKTRDFTASCKNLRGDKLCTIHFCHKCLLNRYGEKAEEVDVLNDWICPKCRGICNCSCCMKRRGQKPTGQLVHTAKASGFASVSEMLDVKVPNNTGSHDIKKVSVSPKRAATSKKEQMIGCDNSSSDKAVKSNAASPKMTVVKDKELVVILSGKHGKENSLDGNSGLNFDSQKAQKSFPNIKEKPKKTRRDGLKEIRNGNRVDDACQNRSSKRNKICNGVSERETKINKSHDIIQVEKKVSKTQTSKDVSLNHNKKDVKEEMNEQDCKGSEVMDDNDNAVVKAQTAKEESKKFKKFTVNPEIEEINNSISLPQGSILTDILDFEFPPEDVGHALQFLEFCRVFDKVLDMKKGEAEAILEELLMHKPNVRRGPNLVVQFHVRLLTLILSESGNGSPSLKPTSGKNSWLKALGNLISGSDIVPKELQLNFLEEGNAGYYNLDLSKKLRLLNFLCDEVLGTENIRSYIDDQNSKFAERAKEAKVKFAAAKEKEKSVKRKLQDDLAKAIISKNGASLSVSEHEGLVSKIKSEAARAHAAMLEAKDMVPKGRQRSDAIRTEPLFLDDNGRAFWKLKCYAAEYAVLLQDIKAKDAAVAAADERWFVYGAEQKHEIEMYISSRAKRPRI